MQTPTARLQVDVPSGRRTLLHILYDQEGAQLFAAGRLVPVLDHAWTYGYHRLIVEDAEGAPHYIINLDEAPPWGD